MRLTVLKLPDDRFPALNLLGASSAVNTVQNHPITQNVKDTITSGERSRASLALQQLTLPPQVQLQSLLRIRPQKQVMSFLGLPIHVLSHHTLLPTAKILHVRIMNPGGGRLGLT